MNKYTYELVVQGNYGFGWDDLVFYVKNAEGLKSAKRALKEYRDNERSASHRIINRKTLNESYHINWAKVYYSYQRSTDSHARNDSFMLDHAEIFGDFNTKVVKGEIIKHFKSWVGEGVIKIHSVTVGPYEIPSHVQNCLDKLSGLSIKFKN